LCGVSGLPHIHLREQKYKLRENDATLWKTGFATLVVGALSAAAAFAGTQQIEPDSNGGDGVILLVLIIGAIIVAANSIKPTKPPEDEQPKS